MTDEALHAFARVLLRMCSPKCAYAVLTVFGGVLPALVDRSALQRAGTRLRGRGTCLTRALAIAARAPGAELVIGIAPRGDARPFAHAWLELGGEPIDPSDVAGDVIARLRRGRSSWAEHAGRRGAVVSFGEST